MIWDAFKMSIAIACHSLSTGLFFGIGLRWAKKVFYDPNPFKKKEANDGK
jgi:hypothetical protein